MSVGQDGKIENKPGTPGNGYGSKFNDTPNPGETTPVTYWGQLQITKVDESDPAKKLEGAGFAVYENATPGSGGAPSACPAVASGSAVATGTSGSDGVVTWTPNTPDKSSPLGLWIGNYDEVQTPEPTKVYCVYETKAPAGYTGIQGPITATIKPGQTLTLDENQFNVPNKQKDGPELPLTGANGTMLMMIGGVALIALAGGVYLVSRRRQAADAS